VRLGSDLGSPEWIKGGFGYSLNLGSKTVVLRMEGYLRKKVFKHTEFFRVAIIVHLKDLMGEERLEGRERGSSV
jgi:hypothetical protein